MGAVGSQQKVRKGLLACRVVERKTISVFWLSTVFVLAGSLLVLAQLPQPPQPPLHDLSLEGPDTKPTKITVPNLPPTVHVSPGANKYVLVKATLPSQGQSEDQPQEPPLWFVKSATPEECGGEYHRFVARALVKELQNLGYQVRVTGGGRIDYNPQTQKAIVYGYSNRYGKGDHVLTASLISKYTKIQASYNLSDDLY